MTPFKIFKVGCAVAMGGERVCLDEAQLSDIAVQYNRTTRTAPIVLGHPEDNQPKYGRIARLDCVGGDLWATPADLSEEVINLVRGGRYRYCSASFLPNQSGVYDLRHVGLLGAQSPAVKGLGRVQFCDCVGCASQAQGPIIDLAEGETPRYRPPAGYAVDPASMALHKKAVMLSEQGGMDYIDAAMQAQGPMPKYTPPAGYAVDAESLRLHEKAMAFSERNGVDYFEAVEAVQRTM